jgi:hypothetical protein
MRAAKPRARNGSARAHAGAKAAPTTNGVGRKRSSAKPDSADGPTSEPVAGPQELAGFVPADIRHVDAEMWPIEPVAWLQPEWKPELPVASGLRVERTHKIPVPGFLNLETGRGYGSAGTKEVGQALPPANPDGLQKLAGESAWPTGLPAILPNVRLSPPQSGLTLLGWDPRTAVQVGPALRPVVSSQPVFLPQASRAEAKE